MFEFASPWWLLALPAPIIIEALRRRPVAGVAAAGRGGDAVWHPQAALLVELGRGRPDHRRLPWLWWLGCMLLAVALARPQWLDLQIYPETRARNLILAIDTSGSMRAQDFIIDGETASRLMLVKREVRRFLAGLRSSRVGLVVFADDALSFLPLTADITLASAMVDDIDQGIAGERTALGDAIALSIERLLANAAAARVLILFTDGANTSGSLAPPAAARLAQAQGVRIYTIAVGSDRKIPFPRGPIEAPVYTELPPDTEGLAQIAALSGGKAYRADDTAMLEHILRDIHQTERTDQPLRTAARIVEWYGLPLLLGLMMLGAHQAGGPRR